MSEVKDNFLVKKVIDSTKEVILWCKEFSVNTCEQEIAVWWKRQWHWMNTKHIGDGVHVLRIHERKTLLSLLSLDVDWMVAGISLYKEFDEHKGQMETYLYRFPKNTENIDFLQNILDVFSTEMRVKREGKFIVLKNNIADSQRKEKDVASLKNLGMIERISFLFGICLVYGSFDKKEKILHSARIQLPLVGSIASFREILLQLQKDLADEGIYTVTDILEQKYGQLWQMSIGDGELLQFFALFLGLEKASKYETLQQQKYSLLEWLQSEENNKISDILEKNVLKFLKR